MDNVGAPLGVAEPVPCPEKKKNPIMQLGPDHNFHAVPSSKFLCEARMVVSDTQLGGCS